MPLSPSNNKAPRRGYYQQRFSTRQMRQLEKISTNLDEEIRILRQQVNILLAQIEGLGYYTDIDLSKLAMIDRLVNTLSRLIQRDKRNRASLFDLETLVGDGFGTEDDPWGQV